VNTLDPIMVTHAVEAALMEDLGRAGDITTAATIPEGTQAKAAIVARKHGVIAGLPLAREAFRRLDPEVRFDAVLKDGDKVAPGTVIAHISGPARPILSAERVALNYLGRLSGIATATASFAEKIAHTPAKIIDTRKTTPNLRIFEKYAVRCGGGANHRFGLDDAVLIKDNHIAVAGGIIPALRAAKASVGHLVKIEIEVDTLAQLDEVIAEGADAVLLDNMTPELLAQAVAKIGGRMISEASGGITLDSVKAIAEAGVDLLSSGWITNSAPTLDLGLDIEIG
jgi:nicotinate-nucleotide pyrophosphorylase (carboxylating)